ncbi:hypothetical protein OHA98_21355 [Streptomyces sp. NBC_00654]|uniref:hypothetical protein n=1 Tax=Streptomyces sp. NBC_00654 TaxID=2975799 RepID=UPI002253092E|nr:hypothetical protein [Streptomyces sp. NBC_00654]MCX4967266.1 hypothetical protein [Streptomyces sp. NBC_00654]
MRVSITHDAQGFITALAASPPDAPVASLTPQAGESVTELDVPEVSAEGDPQQIVERLTDLVENYRIDVRAEALTRKQG